MIDLRSESSNLLARMGVDLSESKGDDLAVTTPITGQELARLEVQEPEAVGRMIDRASDAFEQWRLVPAPRRGELVRRFGERLRRHKDDLGRLVTIESGKILAEGLGEVQEMIDICDFAVGLSRQLYGRTIASERPGHRMMETWHPLGVVGVISAFNFPVAVWAWNATLALVCGDPVVWKPSEKTPLTALACDAMLRRSAEELGDCPDGLSHVALGRAEAGANLVEDPRVALLSATGSTAMGRAVGPRVASRFGRALLELGGNNAMIITRSADLDLALRAITFSAAGTAGQRCTSLRRLIVHHDIRSELEQRVADAFAQLRIGDPLDPATLVGPLIDRQAWESMHTALALLASEGGRLLVGGDRVHASEHADAYYVQPALVSMPGQTDSVRAETFAPVLTTVGYQELSEAIEVQNDVPQGLSSSIMTTDLREAEVFLGAAGSDCGIANVNIGPSGAEIGGAFGGEKETGGGREAGSDSWRSYMRRATNTINFSADLPLAQGVEFG